MDLSAAVLLLLSYTVTDGDTLRSNGVGVRLWGINAAEKDEPGGRAARRALRRVTNGQKLTCEPVGADSYRRILARCATPDGRDIACTMVRQGFARDWPKFSGGYYADCARD